MVLPNLQKVLWDSQSFLFGSMYLLFALGKFWTKSWGLGQADILMLKDIILPRPATLSSLLHSPPESSTPSFLLSCRTAPIEWTTMRIVWEYTGFHFIKENTFEKSSSSPIKQVPISELDSILPSGGNLDNPWSWFSFVILIWSQQFFPQVFKY